jgi:signal transduction histidine kinase
MKAQEEERLNLSRELHDESGQLLAALSVRLGLLEREAGTLAKVQPHLAELKRITAQIQDDLHKLAVNLRPASLDHLGLVTALQQYATEFNRQYGISVEFEATGMKNRRLPGEIETAIFRTVQESLTNVALHARASRVDVLVSRHGDSVVTLIEDDGVGFTTAIPDSEEHLGLFGMRERIEMLGGKFSVESAPGKGTTVRAEVPYHD